MDKNSQVNPNNDHDLLIELRTEMRGLRDDMKAIRDGFSEVQKDHENRIRSVEKSTENLMSKMVFGISIISFIMAIIVGVIINWIKSSTGL